MRYWKLAVGAALLAANSPSLAQDTGTPAENLDCAIWTSVIVGETDDPEVAQGFGFVMNWFIGLYEGATGTNIDEAMLRRIEEIDDAEFEAIAERCSPRMGAFGNRLSELGRQLHLQGN